ncbi:putative uncharacterized protein DDB_G0277255 [Drosophila obscura]|uniref:putative uncharacterized protein DDB_G0277255 n=1 Tax=Drosophila obscura TaxID=7282 RepID=UPI001BB27FAE|nr:putative uncharacterized protein DDB_G0277255 [Drosophila obscura]XP_022209680.2 putative uncharacterized protein DDB_G0277255 [Drosophila obscura]
MIGTEDMSASAGMDISESFRAEDLSKADFFDFVTGPDMGIGIGVGVDSLGVSLHQQQQQHHQPHQQQQHHSQHNSHTASHVQVVHQPAISISTQSPQQALCGGGARTNSSMIHDGGGGVAGGGVPVGNRNGSSNGGDPTLQGYEFWHQDKDNSRLDSTSIFEDLDRYCWQQQPVTASAGNSGTTNTNQPSPTSPQSHHHHQQQQQQQHPHPHQQQQQQQQQQPNPSSSSAASSGAGSSSDTISSLDTTDGQIYTLTVLNGGEPWLKRSEAEQLPSSLDLDSLLGSFPGYIKSEYPYDDSGFSTDGKDVIVNGADGNGLSSISQGPPQTLPSLVTAISIAGGNDLGQQLAQFQNNNNDWHMADHNADTEQSTAESLLRSALQGKGYAKGLHMQNGLAMPVVKEEDMRRLLFTDDAADALGFADSTLNAAQMFDEAQGMAGVHLTSQQQQQQVQQQQQQHNGNANIIVDDMFLSLENAFSDDFEKIKRIANEVQQFCTGGSSTPTPGTDYSSANDVLMQISPNATAIATANQLQPPQPLKPEVSTSTPPTGGAASSDTHHPGRSGSGISKPKKQYKRSSSSSTTSSSNNNNNNNNPNVANNNSSSGGGGGGALGVVMGSSAGSGSSSSSGSASSSSNSPPANSSGSGSSASGASGGGGQRKERSLHYCSICSKGFKDKYSVNVHIRTHTGEKPFACSLCGKSFRQKAHLAKHYQTHMTQKNNGNLIKGSSSKHPRSSGGSSAAAAAAAAATASINQQRQMTPSLPGMISNPNTPPGILPPANGLLTNR